MSKITIFQETFLVSGIMCFDGCGATVQALLTNSINEQIASNALPHDAELFIDAEPHGLGIQKLLISIKSENDNNNQSQDFHSELSTVIKANLDEVFEVLDESSDVANKKTRWTNWINILINLLSIGLVIVCTLLFPASILLTISMAALSFLTTAFTAREYLLGLLRSIRAKQFSTMATTISFGWLLSLGHTMIHSIAMPLLTHFSMVFMNFIMPSLLITCINGVDEIKRLIMEKSKKIQLKGLKTLFPNMSDRYACRQLSKESRLSLEAFIASGKQEDCPNLQPILADANYLEEDKKALNQGMLIKVAIGECFPVDGVLVQGNTVIDASLLTGESQQSCKLWQRIPAGAINLGQPVTLYATKNPYNSTVNSLLFRSNRARETLASQKKAPIFTYVYAGLIVLGIACAIVMPFIAGVLSLSLVVQNIIGIVFSVCPCTIAIAHELPKLLSIHHRSKKNIDLRHESLLASDFDGIHTVVFDKTGTLTTGDSVVESSDIADDSPVWTRVYLLEKYYGRAHPLANAIIRCYEEKNKADAMFNDITNVKPDEHNRGIGAFVQGKWLQLGSYEYLQANHIRLPKPDDSKIKQGFSPVYIAEEGCYQGVIYIKHQIRPGVIDTLTKLKEAGKKIIMLTGDNEWSARGFNQQINGLFDEGDIYAKQTPQHKENFLDAYMSQPAIKPEGVWFCGDGLNDAPCCRMVSEKGGVSCAIQSTDKSAFFTDISLNGSLDYLLKHSTLNRYLKHIMTQNKGILILSTLAFLAFIISFSIAGIAVSPLIPVAIMLSTTLMVIFNSYRMQLIIDNALDNAVSWPKKMIGSHLSMGLLLAASALFISSTLVATLAAGTLALPIITFTTVVAAFSSICSLSAIGLLGIFGGMLAAFVFVDNKSVIHSDKDGSSSPCPKPSLPKENAIGRDDNYDDIFSRQKNNPYPGTNIAATTVVQRQ